MGQKFKDKKVLITGASKGLGKAAAIAFQNEGAKLALAARSDDKLEALTSSFDREDKHLIFNLDLLDSANIKKLSNKIIKVWDGVDIILHCIGGSLGVNDTLVEWKDFTKCLKGNIGIASEINRYLVPAMKQKGFGNIIHVGSIVGCEAGASVPYSTSKAALSGYVRTLGNDLAEHGIIVSGILPGAFYGDDNAMFRYEYYKPEEYTEFVKSLPQGRMPNADEYVSMLFLLANTGSKIMSGSIISMDGAQGQAYYNYSM
jgi:3-oxoacyl-[acyl-carrier protein] reductase